MRQLLLVSLLFFIHQSAIATFFKGEETGQGIADLFSGKRSCDPDDTYLSELKKIARIMGDIPVEGYAPKAQYIKDQLDNRPTTADMSSSLNNIFLLVPRAGSLYARIAYFATSFDQGSNNNLNTALTHNQAMIGGPLNLSLKDNILALRDFIKLRADQGASMLIDLIDLRTIMGGNTALMNSAVQFKNLIDNRPITTSILAALSNLQNAIAGNNAFDLVTRTNQYVNILYTNSNPRNLGTAILALQTKLGGNGDIYSRIDLLQINFQLLTTENLIAKNALGTLLPSPADPSLSERLDEVNALVPGPTSIIRKVQALKDDFDADELAIAQAKAAVGTLQPIPADPILADRLAELNPFLPAGVDPIVRKVQILKNEYDNVKNDLDEAENTINDAWQTADGQSSTDLTTGLHTISALVGNAVILIGVNTLNTQIQDSKNYLGTLLPSPADPSLSERLDEVNALVPGPAPIVQKVQALKNDFDADELVIAQAKASVGTLLPAPQEPDLLERLDEVNVLVPGAAPIVQKVQALKDDFEAADLAIAQAKVVVGTLLLSPADPSLSERLDEVNTLVPGADPIVQKVQVLKNNFDAVNAMVTTVMNTDLGNFSSYQTAWNKAQDYDPSIVAGVSSNQPGDPHGEARALLTMIYRALKVLKGNPPGFSLTGTSSVPVTEGNMTLGDLLCIISTGQI